MNIHREGEELVVRIPIWQDCYGALYTKVGRVHNIMGVVAGDEYSISQMIDMTYKGKAPQEGMSIVNFNSEKELREVCKEAGLEVWEASMCFRCNKRIWGCCTIDSEGRLLHEKGGCRDNK